MLVVTAAPQLKTSVVAKYVTPPTDDLYDLFPRDDLDFSGQTWP